MQATHEALYQRLDDLRALIVDADDVELVLDGLKNAMEMISSSGELSTDEMFRWDRAVSLIVQAMRAL